MYILAAVGCEDMRSTAAPKQNRRATSTRTSTRRMGHTQTSCNQHQKVAKNPYKTNNHSLIAIALSSSGCMDTKSKDRVPRVGVEPFQPSGGP